MQQCFVVLLLMETITVTGAYPLSLVSNPVCHLEVTVRFLVACWFTWPVPLTARFKAWFCGRPLPEIAGSNPAGGVALSLSLVL